MLVYINTTILKILLTYVRRSEFKVYLILFTIDSRMNKQTQVINCNSPSLEGVHANQSRHISTM